MGAVNLSVIQRRRFVVSQNILPNESLRGDFDILRDADVSAVSLELATTRRFGVQETTELLQQRSLDVITVLPDITLLSPLDAIARDGVRDKLRDCARLGAQNVLLLTGPLGDLSYRDADALVVERLRWMGDLAHDFGLTLALEPLNPYLRTLSYVHSLRHAVEIVSQVSGVGVIFDIVHLYWDRAIEEEIATYASYISTVQLSGLSADGISERVWRRAPLGEGFVHTERIVRALDAAGYEGCFEDETLIPLRASECVGAIRDAKIWLESQWVDHDAVVDD